MLYCVTPVSVAALMRPWQHANSTLGSLPLPFLWHCLISPSVIWPNICLFDIAHRQCVNKGPCGWMAVMRVCLAPVIQTVYHLITVIHERAGLTGWEEGEQGKYTVDFFWWQRIGISEPGTWYDGHGGRIHVEMIKRSIFSAAFSSLCWFKAAIISVLVTLHNKGAKHMPKWCKTNAWVMMIYCMNEFLFFTIKKWSGHRISVWCMLKQLNGYFIDKSANK